MRTFWNEFFTPIRTLKFGKADFVSLVLYVLGVIFLQIAMFSPDFTEVEDPFSVMVAPIAWTLVAGLLLTFFYRQTPREKSWVNLRTGSHALSSLAPALALLVHPAWMAFGWILPLSFCILWRRGYKHLSKKDDKVAGNIYGLLLIIFAVYSIYWALPPHGHWSLWIPAAFPAVPVLGLICAITLLGAEDLRNWWGGRSERKEWQKHSETIALLAELLGEIDPTKKADVHTRLLKRQTNRRELIGEIREAHESLRQREESAQEQISALNQWAEELEEGLRKSGAEATVIANMLHKVVDTTLRLLVKMSAAAVPVEGGVLAGWRKDFGSEVICHLRKHPMNPNYTGSLRNWKMSGSIVKTVLNEHQEGLELDPTWYNFLMMIYLENTLDGGADESST